MSCADGSYIYGSSVMAGSERSGRAQKRILWQRKINNKALLIRISHRKNSFESSSGPTSPLSIEFSRKAKSCYTTEECGHAAHRLIRRRRPMPFLLRFTLQKYRTSHLCQVQASHASLASSIERSLRTELPAPLPKAPDSARCSFFDVCAWLSKLIFDNGIVADSKIQSSKQNNSLLAQNSHVSTNFHSLRVFLALALSASSKLCGLAVPILFRYGIELIEAGMKTRHVIKSVAIVFLLTGVFKSLSALCNELRSVVFQPVAQSAGRRVAIYTFRQNLEYLTSLVLFNFVPNLNGDCSHIMSLDIGFHLDRNIGKLSRIVDRGTRSVAMVFRAMLFTFIPTIIELVLVCALLWRTFSPICCIMVLLTFSCYIVFTAKVSTAAAIIRKKVNYVDNLCSGKVVDNLMNVETVKNFDTVMIETRDYNNLLVDYQIESQKSELNSAALNAGQALILSVGATAILMTIIFSNPSASTTASVSASVVGGIVMANGLLLQVSAPLQFLGFFYRELRQSLVDIQDIFDILNTKTKVPQGKIDMVMCRDYLERESSSDEAFAPKGIDVKIDDVWFGYPGRDPVLRGVSIHALRGERIALVGPSGSGKSTLLRLIMRHIDVDEGSVSLDGIDVRQLTEKSLRDAIGVVPQESAMFSGTLESNIRYGSSSMTMQAPDPTYGVIEGHDVEEDEEDRHAVMAALRLSQLVGVVDAAPAGLQTIVGDRGFTLSGGERQRVALARVFLREPRLLLCDEATSALDSNTEKLILASIRELSQGRTVITVAHRLSTIVDCDRIYVMRNGIVEEYGTHDELMSGCRIQKDVLSDSNSPSSSRRFTGLYKMLWDIQSKEEEEDVREVLA